MRVNSNIAGGGRVAPAEADGGEPTPDIIAGAPTMPDRRQQRRSGVVAPRGRSPAMTGITGKVTGPFVTVLLLMFSGGSVWAQGQLNCVDGPQLDLNECAWIEYQATDAALNAEWPLGMQYARGVGQMQADALRAAQRAWITYRDAACRSEASLYEGGSIQPLIVAGCLTRMTEDRIADLRAFRSGQ